MREKRVEDHYPSGYRPARGDQVTESMMFFSSMTEAAGPVWEMGLRRHSTCHPFPALPCRLALFRFLL